MSVESTEVWTGWYRDRRGAEAIALTVGGRRVAVRIRGVEYGGETFAALRADGAGGSAGADGALPLAGCALEWDLPLPVETGEVPGTRLDATLSCLLSLGEAGAGGEPERVELQLTLHCGGAAYGSGVTGGDFDRALDRILRQLPAGSRLGRALPAPA
ncbi:DUF6304 family protein [Streptomyces sp. LP05-1]|uniref:DUF6304 family protein n=1 Tax=Streptomyces pyxinae TaxID=2970734 RepID=A0ABT2CAB2_9ACTN|nr:DUF6304 family protein [Streptomyces sp. LP05-1]MCS0634338.1 DUF6304 family protein [Streptomyces sp. LP05-1]